MHVNIRSVVGDRIREARRNRNLSLQEVASRAQISVATLSRVERDKQGLDLALFMTLCKVLKAPPHELLGTDGSDKVDPLALQIARLKHDDRVQLWRDLADARRNGSDRQSMRSQMRRLSQEVEELLAQLQFVQAEIELVHNRVRRGQ